MPVLMFAVVFGLSMDYEVFLISRVREQWLRHRDASAAARRRRRAHRSRDQRRRGDHGRRLPLLHARQRAHAQGVRLRPRGRRLPRRPRHPLPAAPGRARTARPSDLAPARAGSTAGSPTSTSRAARPRVVPELEGVALDTALTRQATLPASSGRSPRNASGPLRRRTPEPLRRPLSPAGFRVRRTQSLFQKPGFEQPRRRRPCADSESLGELKALTPNVASTQRRSMRHLLALERFRQLSWGALRRPG